MKKYTTIYKVILLFLLSLFCTTSFATITSITVSASKQNLVISSPNIVTVTWRVSTGDNTASAQSTASSYTVAGTTLSSPSTPLTNGVSNGAAEPTFTFTETISVPQSVVFQAQQLGFSSIQYRRNFTDSDQGSATGVLTFALVGASSSVGGSSSVGASGGSLSINRNSMQFGDQSLIKIAQTGESVAARAELNYTGSGLLSAAWEIARPESTRGKPVFSTLKRVSKFLSSGNVETFTIKNLPTDALGFYIVRFRVISPDVAITQPVLQYIVQKSKLSNKTIKPGSLTPLAPAKFSLLDDSTVFSWDPVPGAKAYQLEFYADKVPGVSSLQLKQGLNSNSSPVTGLLVPAIKTKTKISIATRNHLRKGKTYNWQILAIGDHGLIAVSEPRKIEIE